MRVLATITPGPSWLPGHAVWSQGPAVGAHLAYMRDRYDDGALLIGGPLRSGMAGMALLEVADLDGADAFSTADPAVAAGVLTYQVTEILPYFDALSGVRSGGATRAVRTEVSRQGRRYDRPGGRAPGPSLAQAPVLSQQTSGR